MTGWHIRGGYSANTRSSSVDDALADVVEEVRKDLPALVGQFKSLHGTEPNEGQLECLAHYDQRGAMRDSYLTFRTRGEDDDRRLEVMLLSSGGGEYFDWKCQAHRTFVREVMRRMHLLGLDISVSVA